MSNNTNSRLHAIVIGRVQGVSFRYFVMEQVANLGIFGWVRNRSDGSVEVTAEGSTNDLEQLLEALREGPHMARVSNVEFTWQTYTGEFDRFHLKSTV